MADKIKSHIFQAGEAFWESHFDNALEGLAYCQMIFDAQGQPDDYIHIQVNKSFEKLTGLKDAAGKKVTNLIAGIKSSNPELFEIYGRVAMTGKSEQFETYIEPLDRWFLVSVYSPSKKFFVTAIQNITGLKQAEKELENAKIAARNVLEDLQLEKDELAKAKSKDEVLLESIGDAVFACDINGKILLFNKVAEELSGVPAKEALGQDYLQVINFVQEGDEKPSHDWIDQAIRGNKASKMPDHVLLINKDGKRIPVADSASPIKDANGQPAGCIVVFRDFTHEREIERVKTDFISIASHQLRTPVSGLNWLIEALGFNAQGFSLKQKKYVKDLSALSKRLVELIEDLLNFSRIELKTEVMTEKDKIEITSFIEGFIKELKPYADFKKHTIIFKNNLSESLNIGINKKSLYNVLQNLMSNAIDYSPENTPVTVSMERVPDFVKVSFLNTGPGIDKEEQVKIFQRFYRGESAKKIKPAGSGLGLYIVKAIIEGIGGKVGFSSEGARLPDGQGSASPRPELGTKAGGNSKNDKETVFWFTIPLNITNK